MLRPGKSGTVAERHAVGDYIVLHPGQAADEGMMPDAHELVHAGASAKDGKVADRAMPGQHHVVGENDAVAHPAVVRHMAVDQERALVPHRCHTAAACSSGVHRDALADRAVRADLERRMLALELQVLRLGPERREREHARTRPDLWYGRSQRHG